MLSICLIIAIYVPTVMDTKLHPLFPCIIFDSECCQVCLLMKSLNSVNTSFVALYNTKLARMKAVIPQYRKEYQFAWTILG